MDRPDLTGRVALVAGATRGAGRGIAVELGAAGATVYVTGRTTDSSASPMGRPETIDGTGRLIDAAGGRAIAVQVDHARADQVRGLIERIEAEQGRLDILVNDIWGGDPLAEWGVSFWEHDLANGLALLHGAIDTHLITSWHAIPLMIRTPGGFIVEITDGVLPLYRGSLFYDVAKATVNRLALAQGEELRPHEIAAVALSPGFLRSEAMLEHFGVTEDNWRDAIAQDPHFEFSETPRYIGRAVAALAADPGKMSRTGTVTATWQLYDTYAFTDVDGTQPDWGRHARVSAGENAGMLHWNTDMYLAVDGTDFALGPADARVMQTAIDSGALLLRKPRRMVEQYEAMRSEIDPANVLELGIYNGGSTALLALLFRPRRLVAIDITPTRAPALDAFIDTNGLHEVVHPYFGVDQSDRERLEQIVAAEFGTEPLDLVIDDASHLLPETTASFNVLFPRLRPGGLFVLEDWSWQHPRDEDVVGFLLKDEQASQELARRLQAGDVAPPVSRLVLELVLTAAYAPEIVDEVTSVRRGFLVVRRGDASLDPNEFDITQRYGARGRSMLT